METIIIDNNRITLEDVSKVALKGYKVQLGENAKQKILKSRSVIENIIKENKTVYGVNTGFGKFAEVRISSEKIEELQVNLVLSHSAGVGEPFKEEIVRAMMFLKAINLSLGFSGCSIEVVETLIEMLNKGVHPVIPQKGSVGASGDLAPLSHLALVIIGEGEAIFKGEKLDGENAMKKAEIPILKLKAKDGLAILNGTQAMTAVGALAILKAQNILKTADISGAMSVEAMLGTDRAFDEKIQLARGHKGQIESAKNLTELLKNSEIMKSHRDSPHKVQDQYSLRCIPQVHGSARDVVKFVKETVETEINGTSDNPLIFPDMNEVISGGNFHGEPVAMAMDFLAIAISEIANISERRIASLMDSSISELPMFLIKEGGLNSGFMIPQITSASLVSENKILCHPASVDSIPTEVNKEDHVSMGTTSARKCLEVIENTENVLAIEIMCASQGIDFRKPLVPGIGVKTAWNFIRNYVSPVEKDRILYKDMEIIKELVSSGQIVEEVEKYVKLN
jgi:histidine ammonia-lyase